MIEILILRKKFPKAVKKLHQWFYNQGNYNMYDVEFILTGNLNIQAKFNLRDLYDFFDEEGIFIVIDLEGKEDIYYDLHVKWIGFVQNDNNYKTRIEAEEAAFLNAFYLLEEKLNK